VVPRDNPVPSGYAGTALLNVELISKHQSGDPFTVACKIIQGRRELPYDCF
jgi:hypothetical protein